MHKRGFTMLIAVVTGTILLAIAFGMATIALRQQVLASGARDSQVAFYAADSGFECAQYLDSTRKAFAANSNDATTYPDGEATVVSNYCGSPISGEPSLVRHDFTPDSSTGKLPDDYATSSQIFNISYTNYAMCAQVTVTKSRASGSVDGQLKTVIESRGYNTCDPTSPSRLERAVRAVYYESF